LEKSQNYSHPPSFLQHKHYHNHPAPTPTKESLGVEPKALNPLVQPNDNSLILALGFTSV